MGWHQDLKVLSNKSLECILVLENYSDSHFQYIKNFQYHTYYQKPGSLIMLYPNDIIHKINPIKKGYKTLLKFIIQLD